MDASNSITAAVFSAFLKCPTKAHLLAIGARAPSTVFADVEARISSLYKAVAKGRPNDGAKEVIEPLDFGHLWRSLDYEAITPHVDCETAVYDCALSPHGRVGHQPRESSLSRICVPVLYRPWNKPDLSDRLLVCFGALALSQATGLLADTGLLIYGDGHRRRTVRIEDHVAQTRKAIDAIGTICRSQERPRLVLNRHCAVCDFLTRCRGLAIERDDLSLLSAMSVKERAKCNAKGILTIAQLSYGYRPRRRKRTRPDAERSTNSGERVAPAAKNDHKLRALAIRKNQIHVVGVPSLKSDHVPHFVLDTERF